jgi:hypothetical protein
MPPSRVPYSRTRRRDVGGVGRDADCWFGATVTGSGSRALGPESATNPKPRRSFSSPILGLGFGTIRKAALAVGVVADTWGLG